MKLLVNCRIGSLEMHIDFLIRGCHVNCRIGSLEKFLICAGVTIFVNCRIGSLETNSAGTFPL